MEENQTPPVEQPSEEQAQQPAVEKKPFPWIWVVGVVPLLIISVGVYYLFIEPSVIKGEDPCFRTSEETIRRKNYFEADENSECPDGYEVNTLKCPTSLVWCQPVEETDTSDWQTYRNEDYGFEFKYPNDFTKKESGNNNLLFLQNESIYLRVNLKNNSSVDTITRSVNAEEIEIDGRQGYKYFFQEGVGYSGVALIQLGQDSLSIGCDLIGSYKDSEIPKDVFVEDNFDQILSTLKFIE